MIRIVSKARFQTVRFALIGFLLTSGIIQTRSEGLSDHYQIETWKTERGLPQNTVLSLHQTRDGYLWIGTRFGLARFDGVHFTVFDPGNTPEMTSENCAALAEDTENNLWVGTNDGLLRRAKNRFRRFTKADGLCQEGIRALAPSREGGVWIGTLKGFCRIKDEKAMDYSDVTGPVDMRVAVLEDSRGAVWFNTVQGLYRLFPGERRVERMATTNDWKGNRSHFFLEDLDRKIWWGNYGGLHCWDGTEIKTFLPSGTQGRSVRYGDKVDVAFQSSSGELWVTVSDKRLLHVFKEGRFIPFTWPGGETIDEVQCFAEDREGNIWIGTTYDGLIRLQRRFISVFTTRQGLGGENTRTVCEDPEGRIWAGTAQGSISEITDERARAYFVPGGEGQEVYTALVDRSKTVWLGMKKSSEKRSLFQFRNGEFINFNAQAGISSTPVQALFEDRAGNVWIGTPDGVTRFRDGQIQRITTRQGLPHNDVRAILEDQRGDLWFGTDGGGICRLRNGEIKRWSTEEGLSNEQAWAFHEDSEGVLWIGTRSGLNRLKDGKVFVFKREQGLFDDLVNCILEDDYGFFWISCNRGIYRVSRAEMNAVAEGRQAKVRHFSYGAADGMASSETNGENQPAGCKGRDGRLWFPTIQGLAVINPSQAPTNEVAPPVVIEQVIADQELVYGNGVEVESLSLEPHVELRPGRAQVLQIRFTGNSFVAPEKMQFKYRLQGHHTEWRFAGRDRVAYYTNLRPGKYQFEVTACNNHGKWNATPAAFSISVAPHFYQTISFFVGCGMAALGTGFGAHQLRVRVLRRLERLEKFRAIELERARIAKDMHDDLGSSLTHISLMSELATRNGAEPEKLSSNLQQIGQSTRVVLRSLEEIVWATDPRHDTLEGLISFLGKYACDFLRPVSVACRLDFPAFLPAVSVSAHARHNLFLVIKEALTNVIKHAGATEVWVRAKWDVAGLELLIEDNGRGLPPGEGDLHSDGLRNMAQRVESLGGIFAVGVNGPQGLRVRVQVPLTQTSVSEV